MINFMKTFKQSELQLTYPCPMLALVQKMCEICGVELYSTDFFNADLQVDEDYFTAQELTYRDVLEKVAQSTLTTIFIKDNKLYLHKLTNELVEKLDTSYLTGLTVKEKFGPVNALVLGRGDVEDNIESKDDTSISQNGRCEIRFDENEFVEYQREQVIDGMFEQIKGLEYYAYESSDLGVMWLEPCDLIEVEDSENNTYKTIYLSANITINTGISSDIEADIPEETNTEYKVTTKEEKKTLKVERLAKKNEGLIQDVIEQQTETGKKLTQVEQTVDGITQTVSSVETKVETVENKAEQAQTSADNAQSTADEAISKITTTTNKVSEIEQTVDNITSTVSSVETKVEQVENKADIANSNAQKAQSSADTAQSTAENAQSTADNATKQITTTNQKVSQIDQTVSGITQSVSAVEEKVETVETKADNAQSSANNAQSTANTANQNAQNAQTTANNINNNLTQNYYTKTETNSQISQKANEITSTVSQTYSTKTETTDAKNEAIESANASTDKKLEDYSTTEEMNSAITQKADSITQEVTQKVENIQIGGTNLIPNSAPYNLDDYLVSDSIYIERALQDEPTAPFGKCLWIHTLNDLPSMLGVYIIPTPQVLEEGKEYCFSLWLKATAPTNVTVGYARGGQTTFNVTTEYKKFTHKFTALAPTSEAHGFAIYLPAGTVPGRQVFVHSIKLEEGNKNTDWSPAPSDVATKEEMNASINIKANEINQEVEKKVDEETITGAYLVLKINNDTSQAKLNADKIQLSANNILDILSGNSINMSSKNIKIESQNFNVNSDGTLTATNATISGKITASSGSIGGAEINNDGIYFNNDAQSTGWGLWGTTINAGIVIHAGTKSNNIANAPFKVYHDGTVYMTKGQISGSLITSGINASNITGGSLSMSRIRGGTLNVGSGGGYLKVGVGYTHPEVSGLNVGANGINVNSGRLIITSGGNWSYIRSSYGLDNIRLLDSNGNNIPCGNSDYMSFMDIAMAVKYCREHGYSSSI